MSIIKDMLSSGESLFSNPIALDYDYQPKIVPYREKEMRVMASCMRPLFQGRNGQNLFVFGPSGVGKTVASKNLLKEIEEEAEDIEPIYINCWQKNTSFKVFLEICDLLGYKFTQNKRGDELFTIIKQFLNKKSTVIIFDEVDKAEDLDFIYSILEEVYKKTLILITNDKNWLSNLDNRLRSRLVAQTMEFQPYNLTEIRGIMTQRIDYAFVRDVWEESAIDLAVKKTSEIKDLRSGLYLLKEAGNSAESRGSKKIEISDVENSIQKLDQFSVNDVENLKDDTKQILEIIKEKPGSKIGDVYKKYQESGGNMIYKTFQRRISKLEKDKFISCTKLEGGPEGNTTIINLPAEKKLTDY